MELHADRVFVRPVHQVNCESDMNQKIDNIYKKIEAIKDDLLMSPKPKESFSPPSTIG